MPQSHQIELLVHLGLTITQAKIFLMLTMFGTSSAKIISENSGVAREIIYQILPTLQQKGLIETILTTPQTYKAIPPQHAFTILLKHQNQQNQKTKKEIKQTLKTLKKTQPQTPTEYHQTSAIPKGKTLHSKVTNEIKNTQNNINIITSYPKFQKWHRLYAKNQVTQALIRNVKIQVLLQKQDPKHKAPPTTPQSLGSQYLDGLHLKYLPNTQLTNLIIFDNKKLYLDTTPQGEQEKPYLYSNNPRLTSLATTYFQTNWDRAIPLQNIKTPQQNAY